MTAFQRHRRCFVVFVVFIMAIRTDVLPLTVGVCTGQYPSDTMTEEHSQSKLQNTD